LDESEKSSKSEEIFKKNLNGLVAMHFFTTKKEFISENNNIVEEKFSSSFPRENVIFLKKAIKIENISPTCC
jgi:hypothetical protein